MKWNKKGFICSRDTFNLEWHTNRTMVPIPYLLDENTIRVFLTFCDETNVGRIGFVDVDAQNPSKIIGFSSKPVLDIGLAGCFDDSGVLPSSLIVENDKIYLFYSAYQKQQKIPYTVFTGLAVSKNKGISFDRTSLTPILERKTEELFQRSSAVVIKENNCFKMWYASCINWTTDHNKSVPVYDIKSLSSNKIDDWQGIPKTSIKLKKNEYGLSTPSVYFEDNKYKMIYSTRTFSKGYRLGYAESFDGINFERMDDKIGIDVSDSGWDSEMICFGTRFEYQDKIYLFYCGNKYGLDGVGYAELEKNNA
jgi:hypothetical protein